MEDLSEQTQKISKINAAGYLIEHLKDLWISASLNARRGNLKKWNWDLDCIWRILAGDAEKEIFNDYYKIQKKLTEEKKQELLYQLLEKKEIFLRQLQNTQGKGTAYQQDADDYFD